MLLKTSTVIGIAEQSALEALLDWQWKAFLSKQVPEEYLTEFDGFAAGCKDALGMLHGSWCEHAMGRLQVLANMPGTIKVRRLIGLLLLHAAGSQRTDRSPLHMTTAPVAVPCCTWPCRAWAGL